MEALRAAIAAREKQLGLAPQGVRSADPYNVYLKAHTGDTYRN